MSKKYDWVLDEEVRQELVAETVVIMFNDRDLKNMRFDVYAEHKDNDSELYSKADRQQLDAYTKSLRSAVEGAYKLRFGSEMVVLHSEIKDYKNLINLILEVYCRYKNEERLGEIVYTKSK